MPNPTVNDLIWALSIRQGRPYFNEDARRATDSAAPGNDCSGYIYVGLWACGYGLVAPNTSWGLAAWCYGAGLEISVEEALRTRGAILFMGPNRGLEGWGNAGHVAISLGDGTCIETPAWGIGVHGSGIDSALGREWTGAARIPGFDYLDGAAPSQLPVASEPVEESPWVPVELAWGDGPKYGEEDPAPYGPTAVVDVQTRLEDLGFGTGGVDGEFGKGTLNALRQFQISRSLHQDNYVTALCRSYLDQPSGWLPEVRVVPPPVATVPIPATPTPQPPAPTNPSPPPPLETPPSKEEPVPAPIPVAPKPSAPLTNLLTKFVSRKLAVVISTIAALISAKQYDQAVGLAIAYVLAQAHVDAKQVVDIESEIAKHADAIAKAVRDAE